MDAGNPVDTGDIQKLGYGAPHLGGVPVGGLTAAEDQVKGAFHFYRLGQGVGGGYGVRPGKLRPRDKYRPVGAHGKSFPQEAFCAFRPHGEDRDRPAMLFFKPQGRLQSGEIVHIDDGGDVLSDQRAHPLVHFSLVQRRHLFHAYGYL